MTRGITLVLLGLFATTESRAQRPTIEATAWSLSPYLGLAQHSPVGTDWGATPDRSHVFIGVHLEAAVLRVGPATLSYAPTITPFMRIAHHRGAGSYEAPQPTAFGVGLAPFGLAVRVAAHPRVNVFVSSAVGASWFTRVVPVPDSREFNVTLEWGGGIELRRSASESIELGYKFHHLSNVYTREENPGLDANVFYLGWRWHRRPQR